MHFAEINTPGLLATGSVVMLMIICTIVSFVIIQQRKIINCHSELKKANEQQARLILAAIRSEETERKKISAELHDDVGAVLSTVKLYLNQIQSAHLTDQSKLCTLNDCKELLNNTVNIVRELSANLQPATIKDFGLLSTLQSYCDKLNHSSGLKVSLSAQGNINRFQTENELAVFRILQEITSNIIRHADAKNINFSLVGKNNELQVFIEHNGTGLSQEEYMRKLDSTQGLGLKNVQNRLNILKGTIHFQKNDNLMNTISVHIPITINP